MIVRHGEKLGDTSSDKDGGPNLSMRGSARGGAATAFCADGEMTRPIVASGGTLRDLFALVLDAGEGARVTGVVCIRWWWTS